MYVKEKREHTAETDLYDNGFGSYLLFGARAGALRTLVYRQWFDTTVEFSLYRLCEAD